MYLSNLLEWFNNWIHEAVFNILVGRVEDGVYLEVDVVWEVLQTEDMKKDEGVEKYRDPDMSSKRVEIQMVPGLSHKRVKSQEDSGMGPGDEVVKVVCIFKQNISSLGKGKKM